MSVERGELRMTREEAIETLRANYPDACFEQLREAVDKAIEALEANAQSESCEYYALCRHGRDENKLRESLGFCEYCNKGADSYVVKPIEKNNHAFIRFGMNGWELNMKANGWHGSVKIRYCPMCGRDLYVK